MLDEVSSTIRQNGVPRFSAMSNGIGHMSQNQSIYANTIALPKINGSVTTGRGTVAPPTVGPAANGLNSSKVSSSTSPGTNQTKTSIMESSRDQSLHDLESTQLSPIGRSSSMRATNVTPATLHNHLSAFKTPDRSHNATQMRHNSTAISNGGLNITNAAGKKLSATLVPANVTKFMNMSREAGVQGMITSLGLLCLVSLLLALLSLVFLLKISPASSEKSSKYQFEFLSSSEYSVLYDVTLALCAITLCLNLCCLLVCAIQFLFAVKLIKSSHGRIR